MAEQHPSDDLLMDYAAGALGEAMAVLVATHLALCPVCRRTAGAFEAVGGALLDALAPQPVADEMLDRLLARLDEPAPAPAPVAYDDETTRVVPQPLRGYLGGNLSELKWRWLLPGIEQCSLPIDGDDNIAEFLRFAPGARVPRHTHPGTEAILVLQGGFSDPSGHYVRGDIALCDETVDHRPVADRGEPCICFAVSEGEAKLTGPIGRVLNIFRGV